ncbi:MAG: M28 family peptidase [Nitrospirae bacterium]|nr:M28 family peptidase [Nitrospirota bacterium]
MSDKKPNIDRAISYAREIAHPRLVGSEGEGRAARYITGVLKEKGLEVEEEPFRIKIVPWIPLRIGLISSLIFLLIGFLISREHKFISAIITTVILISFIFMGKLWSFLAGLDLLPDLTRGLSSKNIIAGITKGGERRVFLIAHYDSKGQSISLITKILLVATGSFYLILLTLQYVSGPPHQSQEGINLQLYVPFSFAVIIILILASVRTDNSSPGGLDNAGSVGILIELAGLLKERPYKGLSITIIFTGAEELGLLGAYAFLKRHRHELNSDNCYFLNLDGVGVGGRLKQFGKRPIFQILPAFPMVTGLMMDHLPFEKAGFRAMSLGCVSGKTLKIHTKEDNADLLEPEGIEEAGIKVLEILDRLDEGSVDPKNIAKKNNICYIML